MSAVQAHQIWVLFFKGNANPYTELPRAGRHLTSMQVLKACGEKLCEYGRCEVTRSLDTECVNSEKNGLVVQN